MLASILGAFDHPNHGGISCVSTFTSSDGCFAVLPSNQDNEVGLYVWRVSLADETAVISGHEEAGVFMPLSSHEELIDRIIVSSSFPVHDDEKDSGEPINKVMCICSLDTITLLPLSEIVQAYLNPDVLACGTTLHLSTLGAELEGIMTMHCVTACSGSADDSVPPKLLLGIERESGVHVAVVLDLSVGKLLSVLQGHAGVITAAAFLDNTRVITVSADRTFKVWDLALRALAQESSIISPLARLTCVAVCASSGIVAIGSADGITRLYAPDDESLLRPMQVLDGKLKKELKQMRALSSSKASSTAAAASNVIISSEPKWKQKEYVTYDNVLDENRDHEGEEDNLDNIQPVMYCYFPQWLARRDDDDYQWNEEGGKVSGRLTKFDFLIACSKTQSRIDELTKVMNGLPLVDIDLDEHVKNQTIIIVTTEQVAVYSVSTFACIAVFPFMSVGKDSEHSAWSDVGLVQNCCAVDTHPSGALAMVTTSAFTSTVTMLQLTTSELEADENNDTKMDSDSNAGNIAEEITMFTHPRDLPVKSALANFSFVVDNKSTQKTKDKPVTFQRNIKSSGYGKTHEKQVMFQMPSKYKNNSSKNGKSTASKKPKMRTTGYPTNYTGLLSECQQANILPSALHEGPIFALQYSNSGSQLITASADSSIRISPLPFASKRKGKSLLGHQGPVRCLHVSNNPVKRRGNDKLQPLYVTGGADKTCHVWIHDRTDPFMSIKTVHSSSSKNTSNNNAFYGSDVRNVSFFYQDKFIATTCENRLHLYKYSLKDLLQTTDVLTQQAARGKYKCVFTYANSNAQTLVAMTCINSFASGNMFMSFSNRNVSVLDVSSGMVVRSWSAHNKVAHSLCLFEGSTSVNSTLRSHSLLVTASTDSTVKLWDLRTSTCARVFTGHVNRTAHTGLALSPCGRYLASGSEDNAAYLFDIRQTRPVAKLKGHKDVVGCVAFHPHQPQVVTAGYDGRVRFYTQQG